MEAACVHSRSSPPTTTTTTSRFHETIDICLPSFISPSHPVLSSPVYIRLASQLVHPRPFRHFAQQTPPPPPPATPSSPSTCRRPSVGPSAIALPINHHPRPSRWQTPLAVPPVALHTRLIVSAFSKRMITRLPCPLSSRATSSPRSLGSRRPTIFLSLSSGEMRWRSRPA